jgi:hypothetical protein
MAAKSVVDEGLLGIVPHTIRGSMNTFEQVIKKGKHKIDFFS